MNYYSHINRLITNHKRRLQKLQEIEALDGFETAPKILLEIEAIKKKIAILDQK